MEKRGLWSVSHSIPTELRACIAVAQRFFNIDVFDGVLHSFSRLCLVANAQFAVVLKYFY